MTSFTFSLNQESVKVTQADIDEAQRIQLESGDPNAITPEQVASNRQLNQSLTKAVKIEGPPGATRAQAEAIFKQQVNSGALEKLSVGQNVNSLLSEPKSLLASAENLVSDLAASAKDTIGTVANSIGSSIKSGLAAVGSTLDSIKSQIPNSTISVADFAKQSPALSGITDSLDANKVTGMLSQLKKTAATTVGSIGTFGSFGATPESMELSGALKPGTYEKFIKNIKPDVTIDDAEEAARLAEQGVSITPEQISINRQIQGVLSSPTVWSGVNGASNLTAFLGNEKLQQNISQLSMTKGIDSLKTQGLISGTESAENLAGISNVCAKYGPDAAANWLKGNSPPELKTELDQIMRDSQYTVKAVDQKIPENVKGIREFQAFAGTNLRSAVDVASSLLIPSDKVPSFNYGGGTGSPVQLPNVNINLYANTPDADLTYTGDDEIVWDNVNAERLRRGLPSLSDIGYPRPGTTTDRVITA